MPEQECRKIMVRKVFEQILLKTRIHVVNNAINFTATNNIQEDQKKKKLATYLLAEPCQLLSLILDHP